MKYFAYSFLNTNIWIAIIKFGGHHASKYGIIYIAMAAILDLITLVPNLNGVKAVCKSIRTMSVAGKAMKSTCAYIMYIYIIMESII